MLSFALFSQHNMRYCVPTQTSVCKQGHGQACFYLAQLYRSGDSNLQVSGHVYGILLCTYTMRHYLLLVCGGQVQADYKIFWEYLRLGVRHEDSDCIFALADLYFHVSSCQNLTSLDVNTDTFVCIFFFFALSRVI